MSLKAPQIKYGYNKLFRKVLWICRNLHANQAGSGLFDGDKLLHFISFSIQSFKGELQKLQISNRALQSSGSFGQIHCMPLIGYCHLRYYKLNFLVHAVKVS
jgi:hypothetical protein